MAEFFQRHDSQGPAPGLSNATVPTVYLGVDGPRRETPAEARLYRQWGADVLGHNLIPEVFLAHELGLNYTGIVTIRNHSADIVEVRANDSDVHAIPMGIERTLRLIAAWIASHT